MTINTILCIIAFHFFIPAILKDYYEILGVSKDAGDSEIRKAWLARARQFHPDHHPDDPLAEEHFKEVQEAYQVLKDPSLRSSYDLRVDLPGVPSVVNNYFYVLCDLDKVNCYDEITVTFTFSGNGRIFRRPDFDGFQVTGSPFVSGRMVIHEGAVIKETRMRYIISPLHVGTLTVGKATIRIGEQNHETAPFKIEVAPAKCYFMRDMAANGKPLKYTLHYEFPEGEEPLRISELKKNHIIMIPRSKQAYYFHTIAKTMKWVFSIYGMIFFSKHFGLHPFGGFFVGNLIAGINVHLMYFLSGVKSKFRTAQMYPMVASYQEEGYLLGESTGVPLIKGNFLFHLGRSLT